MSGIEQLTQFERARLSPYFNAVARFIGDGSSPSGEDGRIARAKELVRHLLPKDDNEAKPDSLFSLQRVVSALHKAVFDDELIQQAVS